MVLEHAVLSVVHGEEQRFEESFALAQPIISSMPGFVSLRLERCIEETSRYLLLVEWERLEDHTKGFRDSPQYEDWKRLLHCYFDSFPVVQHFESVVRS